MLTCVLRSECRSQGSCALCCWQLRGRERRGVAQGVLDFKTRRRTFYLWAQVLLDSGRSLAWAEHSRGGACTGHTGCSRHTRHEAARGLEGRGVCGCAWGRR